MVINMKTFTKADKYTVQDLLHFGYSHYECACGLFTFDTFFFDSAGYLAHLGTELILKACHLYIFGQFNDTHNLYNLYDKLRKNDSSFDIGGKNISVLKELDKFYNLRYPRIKDGPIEVGSDMLTEINEMHDALWKVFPVEIRKIYESIDPREKGGRILMKKKI